MEESLHQEWGGRVEGGISIGARCLAFGSAMGYDIQQAVAGLIIQTSLVAAEGFEPPTEGL